MDYERAKMLRWIDKYKADPVVKRWIFNHPPPRHWHGTALEWAYAEMPVGILTKRPGKLI